MVCLWAHPALLWHSRCVLHAVATGIFELILDQSPFAIEDLMKELGTHSDEEDASEEGRQQNEEVLKTKGEEEALNCPGKSC